MSDTTNANLDEEVVPHIIQVNHAFNSVQVNLEYLIKHARSTDADKEDLELFLGRLDEMHHEFADREGL